MRAVSAFWKLNRFSTTRWVTKNTVKNDGRFRLSLQMVCSKIFLIRMVSVENSSQNKVKDSTVCAKISSTHSYLLLSDTTHCFSPRAGHMYLHMFSIWVHFVLIHQSIIVNMKYSIPTRLYLRWESSSNRKYSTHVFRKSVMSTASIFQMFVFNCLFTTILFKKFQQKSFEYCETLWISQRLVRNL